MKRGSTSTHGHASRSGWSPEYIAWKNMIARCERPSSQRYNAYGALGITVCDRWRSSFADFFSDMGKRPSPDHSLDRKEVTIGYTKSNCRWATRAEQMRNTRRTRWVDVDGQRISLAEAAEAKGIRYGTVKRRLQRGWTIERALIDGPGAIGSKYR